MSFSKNIALSFMILFSGSFSVSSCYAGTVFSSFKHHVSQVWGDTSSLPLHKQRAIYVRRAALVIGAVAATYLAMTYGISKLPLFKHTALSQPVSDAGDGKELVLLPNIKISNNVDLIFLPVPFQAKTADDAFIKQDNGKSCGADAALALVHYVKVLEGEKDPSQEVLKVALDIAGIKLAWNAEMQKRGISLDTELNQDQIKDIAIALDKSLPKETVYITKEKCNQDGSILTLTTVEGDPATMFEPEYSNASGGYDYTKHLINITQPFRNTLQSVLPVLMNREGHWVTFIFQKEQNGKINAYHTNSIGEEFKVPSCESLTTSNLDRLSDFEKKIISLVVSSAIEDID